MKKKDGRREPPDPFIGFLILLEIPYQHSPVFRAQFFDRVAGRAVEVDEPFSRYDDVSRDRERSKRSVPDPAPDRIEGVPGDLGDFRERE